MDSFKMMVWKNNSFIEMRGIQEDSSWHAVSFQSWHLKTSGIKTSFQGARGVSQPLKYWNILKVENPPQTSNLYNLRCFIKNPIPPIYLHEFLIPCLGETPF